MCFHLMIYTRIEIAYYVRRAQNIQFLNSGGLNFWKYTPLYSTILINILCWHLLIAEFIAMLFYKTT